MYEKHIGLSPHQTPTRQEVKMVNCPAAAAPSEISHKLVFHAGLLQMTPDSSPLVCNSIRSSMTNSYVATVPTI